MFQIASRETFSSHLVAELKFKSGLSVQKLDFLQFLNLEFSYTHYSPIIHTLVIWSKWSKDEIFGLKYL